MALDEAITLISGAGNDTVTVTLNGQSGTTVAHNINLGDGNDTANFETVADFAAVTINGGNDIDGIVFTADAQTVVDVDFANASNLEKLTTANGNNNITLESLKAGSAFSNLTLTAGTADDVLRLTNFGESATVLANSGNDTIFGSNSADSLVGGTGADVFVYTDDTQDVAGETINGTAEQATDDTIRLDATGTFDFTGFTNISNIDVIAVNRSGGADITVDNGLVGTADANNNGTVGDLEIINATGASVTGAVNIMASALTGSNAIYVSATDFNGNDSMFGGNSVDTINGGGGNDTIKGNGGADVLNGGAGNDLFLMSTAAAFAAGETVNGGDNLDTIQLDQAGTYTTGQFSATITGIEFIDLNDATAAFSLSLSDGTYVGADNNNNSVPDNIVTIRSLVNTTFGLTVVGGATTAGYRLQVLDNTFLDGNDTLTGGLSADTLEGGLGNDSLVGLAGADSISAGDGNDTVQGDSADVLLDGGNGTDWLQIGASFEDTGTNQITNFERIALTQTGLTVSLDQQTEDLYILGFASGSSTITAGAGNDTVFGGSGADSILGADGNDSIMGLGGADTLLGGNGNDFIIIGTDTNNSESVNVSVLGGDGNDFIQMEIGELTSTDVLTGDANTDTLEFLTNGSLADVNFTNVTLIEKINLADGGNTLVLGAEAYNTGSGISTVVGGSGNDNITTYSLDAARGSLTLDLSEGGKDTISILNDAVLGAGGIDAAGVALTGSDENLTTRVDTMARWTALAGSKPGVSAVTILGFTGGDGGDVVDVYDATTNVTSSGFAPEVDPNVIPNMSAYSPNSVFEIDASKWQQTTTPTNLVSLAAMLDNLGNVADGKYYIVVYNGGTASADGYLYAATATNGDGFNFADAAPSDTNYDRDTVELIGVFKNVGANSFTANNFI